MFACVWVFLVCGCGCVYCVVVHGGFVLSLGLFSG